MDKLSVLYVVIAGVFWGSAGIFVNQLKNLGFSAMDASVWRNTLSAVLMLVFILLTNREKLKTKRSELILFALSGFCMFAASGCYYAAMEKTSPATAVVLMYTAPIMVTLISAGFLGEKLTKRKTVAVLLSFLGCGLVTGIIGGLRFSLLGIFWGLLSGITYCFYSAFTKIALRRGNDALTAAAYAFVFAGLSALLFSRPQEMTALVAANPLQSVLWAIGIAFFVGFLPYFTYTLSMKKLPASIAAAMSAIEPMTATVISIIFFNEEMTLGAITGIVLILLSVILLSRETAE